MVFVFSNQIFLSQLLATNNIIGLDFRKTTATETTHQPCEHQFRMKTKTAENYFPIMLENHISHRTSQNMWKGKQTASKDIECCLPIFGRFNNYSLKL